MRTVDGTTAGQEEFFSMAVRIVGHSWGNLLNNKINAFDAELC